MNTVRLAAAGSGKTWGICHSAIEQSRSNSRRSILIVSYTNRGIESIKDELEKQNNGVIPANIVVYSWYQFLLRELIKPYQSFLTGINEINTLDFTLQYSPNYKKAGTKERYITSSDNVRAEEASNLALLLNEKSGNLVFQRIEKVYSQIYFDEIQDLAGRDIDILEILFRSDIDITCVGDNKQATFQTHNAKANRAKTGKNVFEFLASISRNGLVTIEESLCSRRFNRIICNFANRVFPNSKNMTTSMTEETDHDGVFIISEVDAEKYYSYYRPQLLRFSIRTEILLGKIALNFGECKGKTFDRCLIYCNEPLLNFLRGRQLSSPEKYYVAVTRARYSNTFVVKELFDSKDFVKCKIKIGTEEIDGAMFVNGK